MMISYSCLVFLCLLLLPYLCASSPHNNEDYSGTPTLYGSSPTDPPEPYDDDYMGEFPELVDCASSDTRVITDEWTSQGTPPNCTFPFLYHGQVYYDCINIDYNSRWWCANDCDFTYVMFHRGECNVDDLPMNAAQGVLGTGVSLNALNVFIGVIMTTAVVLFIGLFVGEMWRKRHHQIVGQSENDIPAFTLPGFEMSHEPLAQRQVTMA